MSVLSEWYTSTYTLTTFSTADSKGSDTESSVTGSCLIRPDAKVKQVYNINQSAKSFKVWMDDSISVEQGQKITIDGDNYTVAGFANFIDLEGDEESHFELVVYK